MSKFSGQPDRTNHYEQIPLFAEIDHQTPEVETLVLLPDTDNRISGLLSRNASQVEAMRLDHIHRMTEIRYQRIEVQQHGR